MRLVTETDKNSHFANWLLEVGNGNFTSEQNNKIALPAYMKVGPNIQSLIDTIYPNIQIGAPNDNYLKDRMILSARNDDVRDINCDILNMFPGEKYTYLSMNEAIIEDGADNHNIYSTEYLNTLNSSGMPPAKLELKIVVNHLTDHVIEARILCGVHAGKTVFIPCITLSPISTNLPFIFKRRQFSIHNAFAITINKSQEQSLMHVGQLYVALSRCTSPHLIKVLLPQENED
ncbi:14324_t:CDS:2, partial [Gigaspora rosea]